MKCKCNKCYKELEEKDQVKDDHAVWCQSCHNRYRMYYWCTIGGVVLLMIAALLWAYFANREKDDK